MSDISDKVLTLSKPYLGPAAESFLERQCKEHLKVAFSALTHDNLLALAECVESFGPLVMPAAKAAELAKQISMM